MTAASAAARSTLPRHAASRWSNPTIVAASAAPSSSRCFSTSQKCDAEIPDRGNFSSRGRAPFRGRGGFSRGGGRGGAQMGGRGGFRGSGDRGNDREGGGGRADRGDRADRTGRGNLAARRSLRRGAETFEKWYTTVGKEKFEKSEGKGPFWLVPDTPFPENPYFQPQAPMGQALRDLMWQYHSQDPQKNNIRHLSGVFGQTMERVHAILRLKALEEEMKQANLPLQTDLQAEMDRVLGSPTRLPNRNTYRLSDSQLKQELQPLEATPQSAVFQSRGPMVEEAASSFAGDTSSEGAQGKLEEAIEEEATKRSQRTRSLVNGAMSPRSFAVSRADRGSRIFTGRSRVGVRPPLRIVNLGREGVDIDYTGIGATYPGSGSAKMTASAVAKQKVKEAVRQRLEKMGVKSASALEAELQVQKARSILADLDSVDEAKKAAAVEEAKILFREDVKKMQGDQIAKLVDEQSQTRRMEEDKARSEKMRHQRPRKGSQVPPLTAPQLDLVKAAQALIAKNKGVQSAESQRRGEMFRQADQRLARQVRQELIEKAATRAK